MLKYQVSVPLFEHSMVSVPYVLHFSVLQPVSAPGPSRDERTVLDGAVEFTSAFTFSSQSLVQFERVPEVQGRILLHVERVSVLRSFGVAWEPRFTILRDYASYPMPLRPSLSRRDSWRSTSLRQCPLAAGIFFVDKSRWRIGCVRVPWPCRRCQ